MHIINHTYSIYYSHMCNPIWRKLKDAIKNRFVVKVPVKAGESSRFTHVLHIINWFHRVQKCPPSLSLSCSLPLLSSGLVRISCVAVLSAIFMCFYFSWLFEFLIFWIFILLFFFFSSTFFVFTSFDFVLRWWY